MDSCTRQPTRDSRTPHSDIRPRTPSFRDESTLHGHRWKHVGFLDLVGHRAKSSFEAAQSPLRDPRRPSRLAGNGQLLLSKADGARSAAAAQGSRPHRKSLGSELGVSPRRARHRALACWSIAAAFCPARLSDALPKSRPRNSCAMSRAHWFTSWPSIRRCCPSVGRTRNIESVSGSWAGFLLAARWSRSRAANFSTTSAAFTPVFATTATAPWCPAGTTGLRSTRRRADAAIPIKSKSRPASSRRWCGHSPGFSIDIGNVAGSDWCGTVLNTFRRNFFATWRPCAFAWGIPRQ